MKKKTAYMVCDWHKGKVHQGARDVCVEHMGNCGGRILEEDGTEVGRHNSSTFGWLREDLKSKLKNPDDYNIIDLIEEEVPERFKILKDTT